MIADLRRTSRWRNTDRRVIADLRRTSRCRSTDGCSRPVRVCGEAIKPGREGRKWLQHVAAKRLQKRLAHRATERIGNHPFGQAPQAAPIKRSPMAASGLAGGGVERVYRLRLADRPVRANVPVGSRCVPLGNSFAFALLECFRIIGVFGSPRLRKKSYPGPVH